MTYKLLKKPYVSVAASIFYMIAASLFLMGNSRAEVRILTVPGEFSDQKSNELTIKIYVTNDSGPALVFTPPPTIKARLNRVDRAEGEEMATVLRLSDVGQQGKPFQLAAGQFRILSYNMTLPEDIQRGQNLALTLDMVGGDDHAVFVMIPPEWKSASSLVMASNEGQRVPKSDLEQDEAAAPPSFFTNFSGYEPIYFLYGTSPANAKFQISFKYRLINPHSELTRKIPWTSRFHLGYTQTAYWDLSSESRPFADITFQPALFYLYELENPAFLPSARYFSVLTGVQHQSNGKGGLDSRSLNFGYIEPRATFSIGDDMQLDLRARAWVFLGDRSDNPDIGDFRGNGLISVGIGRPNGWMLTSELRGNPGTGKGNIKVNLSYPLNRILSRDLYFFGQLYSGYGESLINYNRKDTRLRFGIALYR
ncbi:MAG: hypothetical protein GXP00_02480 [Alphaproteobacteria bacterium]|nr:hypothetical protein [Alphaproteobacteria bacterium]